MAPPQPRRLGFSRPAQYLLFASYVAAVLGALLGLLLLVTAWADPVGHRELRSRVTDVTAPLSLAGSSVVRGTSTGLRRVADWWNAGAQNAALRHELEDAQVAMVDVSATKAENARLKRLLRVVERDGAPVAVSRLVASSPGSVRRFGVLPVGRSNGVRPNQSVRGPTGLVGRVVEAGAWSARVLLITDTASVVPVRRASDDLSGVAQGDGQGGLQLRPLANRRVTLRAGDVFVTNGVGGVFPPGVPVAVVRRGSSGVAAALPLNDPNLSDTVLVLPTYEPAMAAPPPPNEAADTSAPVAP